MSSVYRIENEEGMGPLGRRGIELTHEIMYRHYRRDEDFVYAQMAEGVTWIGPSRAQYTTGVDKLRELLQIEQLVTFTMEQETYQVAYEDEHSCLIFGCCTVTSDEETGLFIRTLQRVSFFLSVDWRPTPCRAHASVPPLRSRGFGRSVPVPVWKGCLRLYPADAPDGLYGQPDRTRQPQRLRDELREDGP